MQNTHTIFHLDQKMIWIIYQSYIINISFSTVHCRCQTKMIFLRKIKKQNHALVLLKEEEIGRHKTVDLHLLPSCSDFEERRQEAIVL